MKRESRFFHPPSHRCYSWMGKDCESFYSSSSHSLSCRVSLVTISFRLCRSLSLSSSLCVCVCFFLCIWWWNKTPKLLPLPFPSPRFRSCSSKPTRRGGKEDSNCPPSRSLHFLSPLGPSDSFLRAWQLEWHVVFLFITSVPPPPPLFPLSSEVFFSFPPFPPLIVSFCGWRSPMHASHSCTTVMMARNHVHVFSTRRALSTTTTPSYHASLHQ